MIKEINFTENYQLRHQLINPEKGIDDTYLQGDEIGLYFGCFLESDLVGSICFYPETEKEDLSQTILRIRGITANNDF